MKIALAVGHTASGTVGSGAIGFLNESNETRKIVPIIADYLNKIGHTTKILRVDKGNSYLYEDCHVRANQSNGWGADLYVEVHLNCSDNPDANGTEVIVSPKASSTSISYAKKVNNSLVKELGTFDRTFGSGYKTSSLIVLNETNCPAILIEPLFVGNKGDVSKYLADKVAYAIATGIDDRVSRTTTAEKKKEVNRSMYLFSKNWYLYKYPDVANSGYKDDPYTHYVKYGKKEGRLPIPPIPKEYKEADYLELNPDVSVAVEKGTYSSGLHHYISYGFKENRKVSK